MIYISLHCQNPHLRDHPHLYHHKPCPGIELRDGRCLRLHNHHLRHYFYVFILVIDTITFCSSGKLGAESDFAHGLRPDCSGPACWGRVQVNIIMRVRKRMKMWMWMGNRIRVKCLKHFPGSTWSSRSPLRLPSVCSPPVLSSLPVIEGLLIDHRCNSCNCNCILILHRPHCLLQEVGSKIINVNVIHVILLKYFWSLPRPRPAGGDWLKDHWSWFILDFVFCIFLAIGGWQIYFTNCYGCL